LGLAVFLLAAAALEFTRATGRVAAVWPANAVVVAAFLRTPARRWRALGAAALLGCLGANLAEGDSLTTALGLALANGAEITICAGLMRRFVGAAPDLTHTRQLLRFVGAGLVAPLASALAAAYVLAGAGHPDFWRTFAEWYPVDALGLLIVTPALMTVTPQALRDLRRRARTGRAWAPAAALAAALATAFGQEALPLQFLVMPALLFCALTLDVLAAALGVLATAVVAVVATLTGHGPAMMIHGDAVERLHALQGFLLMQSLVVLPISAVIAGRSRLEASLKASLADAEQAKLRLEESEGRYRLLADASSDVVIKIDRHDVIQYASPSVRRYGYSPEDLIGVSGFSLVHPDDKAKLQRIIGGLFSTGQVDPGIDRTYRLRGAGGGWAWFEGNPTIIKDDQGAPVAVVSQLRDISEKVAAMHKLAESETRYRLLADNATDTIFCYRRGGIFTYVSPAVAALLGYEPGELLGNAGPLLIHPEDQPAVFAHFQGYVDRGPSAEPIRFSYRAFRKDGSMVWLEAHPRAIYDQDGQFMEFQDVVRDITAHVELEGRMREAQAAAEAAAEAKGQFLANMSHEIRTPLTAILGFAGLLAERGKLDELGKQHLERVRSAGHSLLSIVNDILDFSKLEAGGVELKPRPTRLAESVHEILLMFAPQAAAKGLALDFATTSELPEWVELDLDRLRQVLFNLVGNAMKFTDTGSVGLRLAYDFPGQRARIEVADTGPGIEPEDQQRLFQRFQQVDSSTTRRHGGTGLGLAISKGLIEAMGGDISLTSAPGVGSTFAFEISAPVCDAPANQLDGAGAMASLDGARVLVVDDNIANREIALAILEAAGAEVSLAESGARAVALAAGSPFDVILMDRRMPGMDGEEAMRRIREQPGPNDNVPILAFTADAQAGDGATPEGYAGVVRKPIVAEELIAAIDRSTRWTGGPTAATELADADAA
jgi:PAS domain S-box-containing protein